MTTYVNTLVAEERRKYIESLAALVIEAFVLVSVHLIVQKARVTIRQGHQRVRIRSLPQLEP